MLLFENLVSKKEKQKNNSIGQIEVDSGRLSEVLVNLLTSMGMANPAAVTSHSSKAIVITKNGNKYVMVLYMYKPPLKITWSDFLTFDKLNEAIDLYIKQNKKIAFINTVSLKKNIRLVQFALI